MKRSSYVRYTTDIELKRTPLKIWGYDREGNFVCRIEITGAGLALYTGTTGGEAVADLTWEQLVSRLTR